MNEQKEKSKNITINEGTLLPVSLVVLLAGAIFTMTRTMADVEVHDKEINHLRKTIAKERLIREKISASLIRLETKLGTLPKDQNDWP